MTARIAIPEPTSFDTTYNQRTLPHYLSALQSAGAIPIVIALDSSQADVARSVSRCNGVLLPGSKADIEPQGYGQARIPECAPSDSRRQAVDELLLQEAFSLHKPLLGICYGIQALCVWRSGTLVQHLATAPDHELRGAPSKEHPVSVSSGSRLEMLIRKAEDFCLEEGSVIVNSSHHQAVDSPGGGMKVVARAPQDGVIEAIELDSLEHFALGVQWHPERTYLTSAASRALFAGFVSAAEKWRPRTIQESVARP